MTAPTGYLRRNHKKVVDGEGRDILLRGMGLGNWWLPEGYMWRFGDAAASPREIETVIETLIGPERAAEFWHRYRDEYIGEADVSKWRDEGWNSVRLPVNARYFMTDEGAWIEESFAIVERFLGWCETYGIYVVLDLHGAPGGQTGTNIDDSPNNYPELFVEKRYQDQTVELWCEFARRYRDRTIIAGYDLLNEPLPREFQYKYPAELIALYKRLIAAIREIDPHHMMILEGSNWARNWSIFDELWDENTLLQFHKYWNAPDVDHIQEYLDKRDELDVPIYMGEGGENNHGWYQGSFQLYEDHDIAWNFWVWKKLSKKNSPAGIREPEGWQAIVDYVYGGEAPSRTEADATLFEFLDNLAFEKCIYRSDVVNAIMRRAPLRIEAPNFGYLGPGTSFAVARPGTPLKGMRESDAVTIAYLRPTTDLLELEEPNFRHNLGQPRGLDEELALIVGEGDWYQYEFTLAEAGDVRVALIGSAGLAGLSVDGGEFRPIAVGPVVDGSVVDGASGVDDASASASASASPFSAEAVVLRDLGAGVHRLRVRAGDEPVGLVAIEVEPAREAVGTP